MSIDLAGVRAGVVAGLHNNDQAHILSSRSGENVPNDEDIFGFVDCASLHYPERHFLSCFWPYHCRSVIPAEFRPSAGNVLQRPRPGNPSGESRIKLNAVMVKNLPRHRRRQRAGTKADGLAPRNRGWYFSMVPENQDKPLAFTKKQEQFQMLSTVQAAKKLKTEVGQHDFKGWYRFQYLKSDHWKKLRAEKIKSTPVCEICKNNNADQVHHRRYRSIYDVGMDDLQSVCRDCHCGIHDVAAKENRAPFAQFRKEYEAQEKERDERDRKRKLKAKKKGRLEGDASIRYANYLEKTAPFKFRGNRY